MIKDGGPAFPQGWHPEMMCDPKMTPEGMTLRDYFAAKAMQSMIHEYMAFNGACFDKEHFAMNVPIHAYRMADAMLKARTP